MDKIKNLRAKLRDEFEQAAQEAIEKGTGDKMLDAIITLASVENLRDALKKEKQLVDMCKMSNIDLNCILDDEFYYVCNKYIDDASMDRMLEAISNTNISSEKSTTKKTWEITDKELLKDADPEGFKQVKSAVVTESEQDWGISRSICLTMKDGRKNTSLCQEAVCLKLVMKWTLILLWSLLLKEMVMTLSTELMEKN